MNKKQSPHNLASKLATIKPKVVIETKQHWFGLFSLYALTVVSLGVILFGFFRIWERGLFVALTIFVIITLFISFGFILFAKIYWSNKLTVTEIDIRQVLRKGLFSFKTSFLNLASIEDVTVAKQNAFAIFFNYGTINIETAGEQENFSFRYCPNPEHFMRVLNHTREMYLREISASAVTSNV